MEPRQLAKSEGLSAALSFIKAPPQRKEDKVTVGRAIIDGLINQAGVLKETAGITNFYLGGLIGLWKKEDLWREASECQEWWQFGDFCKAVLKMSLQKANILARTWNYWQYLGLNPEDFEKVGWAKAQFLSRVASNKKEAELWLEEAQTMGQEQFIEKVKAKRGGKDSDSARSCRKLFLFTSDERDFIDETIEYAASIMKKELGAQVSASEVLVFILTGWRGGYSPLPDNMVPDVDETANKPDEEEWFQAMIRRSGKKNDA